MNPHEKRNRTKKVRRLCRTVRNLGRGCAEPHQLAHWIERAGFEVLGSVAVMAKVNPPSAQTWARVVVSLRVYKEPSS